MIVLFALLFLGAFDFTLDWPFWIVIVLIILWAIVVLAIGAAIVYVAPNVEFLATGSPTRFQRSKKLFVWLAGVIIIAIVSAVIAKVI